MQDVRAFVDRYSHEIHGVETRLAEAEWELETTSSGEAKTKVVALQVQLNTVYRNPEDWILLRGYYEQRDGLEDITLRREVELLYARFARNQDRPERVEERARLSADVGADFTSFRSVVNGNELSDNEVNHILRTETDSDRLRAAWEAGKAIGPVVAERVIRLARLRNEAAREMEFRDFYAQRLTLEEIDEAEMFRLFEELEVATREPFARMKGELDSRLSEKFDVPQAALMPWHYGNPFFQEPPSLSDASLESVFIDVDLAELSVKSFDRLSLGVRDILDRSDLYERPAKNQHAFCIHIDALSDDVRILCNLRSNEYWANTMLHELGHAVYDKYLSPDLPFLLRGPAHTNSTEAIAMLMGRLVHNQKWLQNVVGVTPEAAERLGGPARRDLSFQMLTFVRWVLVMTHFERELYANPDRPDLNELWWQLVSRFQMLKTPDSRQSGEHPDWAAKIHLALYPAYYHNYLIGELTASQIQATLESRTPDGAWFDDPAAGTFLRSELFDLGARYPWDVTVRRVTGKPLTPDFFVQQFVDG